MPLKDPVARAAYQREHRQKNLSEYVERNRAYRKENPEKILERNRKYRKANSEKVREWVAKANRKWRAAHREQFNEMVCKWEAKNPEKRAAHYQVHKALKKGTLTRPYRCEHCRKICQTQGHHEDYSKPLEVVWLCSPCHKQADYRRVSSPVVVQPQVEL